MKHAFFAEIIQYSSMEDPQMIDNPDQQMINNHDQENVRSLGFCEAFFSGNIIGMVSYVGSFSAVPMLSTTSALLFGTTSLTTTITTAFAQLWAGYSHTDSSRIGRACSKRRFGGVYKAEPSMRNRRQQNETRRAALRRFFLKNPDNAYFINVMWETFTFGYVLQSTFLIWYCENYAFNTLQHNQNNGKGLDLSSVMNENHIILINGITRLVAGLLAAMLTGAIDQLWQRFQCITSGGTSARFVTNPDVDANEFDINCGTSLMRLTQNTRENWIKFVTMIASAVFTIVINTTDITDALSIYQKRYIADILVIHGGWLILRDFLMIMLMSESPNTRNNNLQNQNNIQPNNEVELPMLGNHIDLNNV